MLHPQLVANAEDPTQKCMLAVLNVPTDGARKSIDLIGIVRDWHSIVTRGQSEIALPLQESLFKFSLIINYCFCHLNITPLNAALQPQMPSQIVTIVRVKVTLLLNPNRSVIRRNG